MSVKEAGSKRRISSWVWVLIVLVLGAVVGVMLAAMAPPAGGPADPGPAPPGLPSGSYRAAYALSAVDLSLLVALIYVYARTFLETRARFALGLAIFLVALALQTFFGSPVAFVAFGFGPGGLGPLLSVSYVFETVALSVFLLLSLE